MAAVWLVSKSVYSIRQEVEAVNLLKPGPRNCPGDTSAVFCCSESHGALQDSRRGNIDPTSYWEECQRICSHV